MWALDLVEVRGSRADGETSISRGCSVSLVVTLGCSFPTSWRCMSRVASALCLTLMVLREPCLARPWLWVVFLLLWLVKDWLSLLSLVHEAHPPTLFRSESRVAFLQVLGLFEFIAYLTGLNSNPSGSSDPWVAVRPSGSLAGVREVASFPAGFKCELQESVAAIAGCTCYERGCWFTHAAVEFVIDLRIRVGSRWSLVLGDPSRAREFPCDFARVDAFQWCSVYVFSLVLMVSCRDTRQKATCNLSRSGGDRLAVAFPSTLQFLFPIVAEDGSWAYLQMRNVTIRRRHPGRRDLVATGWSSPSCLEGDAPVVAFWLPVFLAVVCALVGRRSSWGFSGGCYRYLGPPVPVHLLEGVLRAAGLLKSQTLLVLSRCLALRWFWSRVGRQESAAGELEVWMLGPPLSFLWRWLGCYCCDGVSHIVSKHPTAIFCNPFLGAVRGGNGTDECVVRAEGCFCIVFDSAGSAGVMSGPTLVVGRVLAALAGVSRELPFCKSSRSVGGGATFDVLGGGLGGRVVTTHLTG
ncbi:hypothetical protein Taro_043737 [Colocasia esculenta]|uniref:Uncharacterized protein n=1 Tax=Colocasia esculenta TaxID=4460 RepID=A0A843WS57_COLES|nr:hypothetical protein [Colocasia esculenta]